MHLINVLNEKIAFYRVFRMRHRYLFTRGNRLRLRYVVSVFAIFSVIFTTFLGQITSSVAHVPARPSIVYSNVVPEEYRLAFVSEVQEVDVQYDNDSGYFDGEDDLEIGIADDALEVLQELDNISPVAHEKVIEIKSGDTVAGALQNAGVSGAEAYRAVKAMSKSYDLRSIRPGQAISLDFEPSENGLELDSLKMKVTPIKELVVTRDENKRFSLKVNKKEVVKQVRAAKASIETSLYGSAARAGIPAFVVAEIIKIYSYDVDFQRDIRRGDKVEVLYETYETEDGDFARYGDVLYASLMVGGKSIPVYCYSSKGGVVDYYRENGRSLKRTLMQTPIDGARMSSGYGMRHHPVLGYNKMHKGIDFAASRGTPIYAAGDGVIEKAGRNGGYGNYVRIRHNNGLKTAYAHMKRFASNIKKGKRVEQGSIIGYVGTTGRSTGPHLHFEVLKNGKQVNPKSIKSSSGDRLAGRDLKDFKARILSVRNRYMVLAQSLKFARN